MRSPGKGEDCESVCPASSSINLLTGGQKGKPASPHRGKSRFRFDRKVAARSPFRPGAVIERLGRFADGVECEPQNRGGQTGSATGDDRPIEVDAAGSERLFYFFRRRE